MRLTIGNPLSFLFVIFLCLFVTDTKGQNLVPNGDFEEHTGCPNILSIFYTSVSDWYGGIAINVDPTSTSEGASNWPSPDWFHSCGTAAILSTPLNIGGFQDPLNGEAIGGFINYTADGEYREIISVPLTETLVVGETYTVAFSLSRGSMRQNHFSTSRIGFRLTTFESYTTTENLVSSWTHGEIEELVSDTANWQEYAFEFIADSSYQYLHIGNFYPTSEIEIALDEGEFDIPPLLAYYFIDGVSLTLGSTLSSNIEDDHTLVLYPNPSNGTFQISNSKGQGMSTISIYNLNGKLVFKELFREPNCSIDISEHGSGLYTLTIETESGGLSQHRVLIE